MTTNEFKPALLIIDLQEDFCPPNGSLAVPHGRDTVPIINKLLSLPFALKVATKDWHPASHISFASNHPGKKPYHDTVTIVNPDNATESYESRLWPDHCIQHTPGAHLVADLDTSRVDIVIEKGQRSEVEMYSAFYDPLERPRVSDSGLAGVLRDSGVSHVYVAGLAADYCVKETALHAAAEGFGVYIVEDGTRPVDEGLWESVKAGLKGRGVEVVALESESVRRVG